MISFVYNFYSQDWGLSWIYTPFTLSHTYGRIHSTLPGDTVLYGRLLLRLQFPTSKLNNDAIHNPLAYPNGPQFKGISWWGLEKTSLLLPISVSEWWGGRIVSSLTTFSSQSSYYRCPNLGWQSPFWMNVIYERNVALKYQLKISCQQGTTKKKERKRKEKKEKLRIGMQPQSKFIPMRLCKWGAGEIAQQLGMLFALAEDLS